MNQEIYQPLRREYEGLAPVYDRRWARYVAASARETLRRIDIRPGERVLDCGCGTGVFLDAAAATQPNAVFTGLDLTPEMLKSARRRLANHAGLAGGLAEVLPFADEVFDMVVSVSVFHFIRAPRNALREVRRVLKPGGRLVLTDWCRDYLTGRVRDMLLRRFSEGHVYTYTAAELGGLLRDAGFADMRVERYRISPLWGLMTAAARKPPADRRQA